MNGLANRTNVNSNTTEQVVYKDDMLIEVARENLSKHEKRYIWFSVVAAIFFYGSIVSLFILGIPAYLAWWFSLIFAIIYYIASCFVSSTKYIKNVTPLSDIYRNVEMAI